MQPLSSQAEFAAALFDPAASVPAGLTTARGLADPVRFDVYRNNVMVALIGALEQRFPVVCRLTGEDFFRIMARAYVRETRPSSPLIFRYGDDFPDFIAGYEAARDVAYLADVARLEAAWTRAYHAAEAGVLDVPAVAALVPEALPSARLVAHPSATLVRSPYPIGSIWAAHQADVVTPVADWRGETLLVVRPEAEVKVHILPQPDADFAAALFAGRPLGEAAQAATDNDGFDFGAAIVGLISLGAFKNIDLSTERTIP